MVKIKVDSLLSVRHSHELELICISIVHYHFMNMDTNTLQFYCERKLCQN